MSNPTCPPWRWFVTRKDEEIEKLTSDVEFLNSKVVELEKQLATLPLRLFTIKFSNNQEVKVVGHTIPTIDYSKPEQGFVVHAYVNGEQRNVVVFKELPITVSSEWLPETTDQKIGLVK